MPSYFLFSSRSLSPLNGSVPAKQFHRPQYHRSKSTCYHERTKWNKSRNCQFSFLAALCLYQAGRSYAVCISRRLDSWMPLPPVSEDRLQTYRIKPLPSPKKNPDLFFIAILNPSLFRSPETHIHKASFTAGRNSISISSRVPAEKVL